MYEDDKATLDFTSAHAGMGSFLFTPNIYKNYKIKLKNREAHTEYALPEIHSSGKVFQLLETNSDYVVFKINQSKEFEEEKVHLRLQIKGDGYLVSGRIKDELQLKIPIKDLPQGIAEVTLFDENLTPIAERLVYVNAHKKIHIKANLDKSEYHTKDKVQLHIKATDENGVPVVSHLGLRIFGHLYKNNEDSKTIESHYHLTSQLKGRLYNPSYYFDEKNANRQEALNLLLLTQGWRAYKWTESNLRESQNLKLVVFDSYRGVLKPKNRKIKKAHSMAKLFSFEFTEKKTKTKEYGLMMTDSLGRFTIASDYLKLVERDYLYISPFTDKKKFMMKIREDYFNGINKKRTDLINYYPIKKYSKPVKQRKPFVFKAKYILDEVTVKTKKGRSKYSKVLRSFLPEDDFVDRIRDCQFTLRQGDIYIIELDDGTFKRAKYYKKYRGNDIEKLLKELNWSRIKGYYGKKEFYKPVYDKNTEDASFLDTRTSLFWKPDIITNAQGEATITFYCSDINSLYFGEIEGVSGKGLLGSDKFKFSVVK
ncbi:hypothetical protein [uncultured Algibacter sp.]|uniref:hypothetical protein n=1 Tax=uncultured Algibacter sp. TaxID=298659 RepID=UPI0026031F5C|nr:hypothetical protein [uncultured Algibacter sp.]